MDALKEKPVGLKDGLPVVLAPATPEIPDSGQETKKERADDANPSPRLDDMATAILPPTPSDSASMHNTGTSQILCPKMLYQLL